MTSDQISQTLYCMVLNCCSLLYFVADEVDEDYEGITDLEDVSPTPAPTTLTPSSTLGNKDRLRIPRVRLVEISLVGMALILWAAAIVLFFHRWGKIRMLLPYQPDYKEMKRNNSVCANCSMTPHHQVRNYDLFSMDSRITI